VDFRLTGEKPRRGMELHGNITVWTNAERTRIHRLMFLSYAKLLDQPDRPLAGLKELPARQRAGLLKLAKSDPVKRHPCGQTRKSSRFRVAEPGVRTGLPA
jgi:hypothetical protein